MTIRTALATAALLAATTLAHAAPLTMLHQFSSAAGWGANGAHADLVIYYSAQATVPLTLSVVAVNDVGGGNSSALGACGVPVIQGEQIVAHIIQPGATCTLVAARSADEVVGEVQASDSTGTAANAIRYVRASLEMLDSNNDVLQHIEVR